MDKTESWSDTRWECKYHIVLSSQNVVAGRCTVSFVGILGRCFVDWQLTIEIFARANARQFQPNLSIPPVGEA